MVHGHGVLNNILLEHGGQPFIFPFKVHLDFGHHCNTQWYLRLLSETCNPTQSLIVFYLNMVDYLDRVVDRVKPWFMVHGLAHGS